MLEDKQPNLLIYGQEAHMNGSKHIKQKFPNLSLTYIGDDSTNNTEPDLVIGKSSTRKCMELPEKLYDITNLLSGTKRPSMSCKMCCFTDSMNQDMVQSISDVMTDLFERNVRFFGNVRLDVHQYLGIVSEQERVDIIKSADIYVDLSEDYWHKSVMLGTTPIVLTSSQISGINTFTNKETLDEAIKSALQGSYSLSIARDQVTKNTGFDFCANLFSALGAAEAKDAVLQSKEKFV
jgi:hypothetical protein